MQTSLQNEFLFDGSILNNKKLNTTSQSLRNLMIKKKT